MLNFKSKYSDYTDEKLMELMVEGDASAFNQLYQRYSKRLLYYFYRMLGNSNEKAQDFLQDIFIKLMQKGASFDTSKKFSTWIFCIAHNMCKNEYRRLEIRKDIGIEFCQESLLEEEETYMEEITVELSQFSLELFEELQTFDEIHKSAFLLRYREGLPVKEIAVVLEISEGTVKSRLFYTRKKLSEKLAKYRKLV